MSGTIVNDKVSGGSLHDVEKVITHEAYGSFQNDVALLKIKGEFLLGESRKIIELNREKAPLDVPIIVSGWGRVETGGALPRVLKWNTLTNVDSSVCGAFVDFTNGLVCLGHPPQQGVCNGDSGLEEKVIIKF